MCRTANKPRTPAGGGAVRGSRNINMHTTALSRHMRGGGRPDRRLTQSSQTTHVPARLTLGELFTPRARLRLAPRPTYSTVAQSGTWLGLGLGLGLGSARARARVGRLGLGLAWARVGTSQCMPRRHAAAREPLSRTDGLERAQALIGLLLARVSK